MDYRFQFVIRYHNNINTAFISNVELSKNNCQYNLNYNTYGQLESISKGTQCALFYVYPSKNDETISGSLYNNDIYNKPTTIANLYDDNNYISKIIVNGKTEYSVLYTGLGNTISEVMLSNNRRIRYIEDANIFASTNSENTYQMIENMHGNYEEIIDNVNYFAKTHNTCYNIEDGTSTDKSEVVYNNDKSISIISNIDSHGRHTNTIVEATNTNHEQDGCMVENVYNYYGSNLISGFNQVETYTNKIYNGTQNGLTGHRDIYYEYDDFGNIVKEYDCISAHSMMLKYSYEYDEKHQLVRYNDNVSNPKRSYLYEYDSNGNIIFKSTYSYTPLESELKQPLSKECYKYGNNNKLIEYNNKPVTYDDNDNPISFNGANLVWNDQQQLISYIYTDSNTNIITNIQYEYNTDGLMTKKSVVVNNVLKEDYNYSWNNGLLISQIYTNHETSDKLTYVIKYVYDSANSPQGVIVNHSESYLYLKNLQGDIIGLVDDSGNVVLSYEYDVWGVPTIKHNDIIGPQKNIVEKLSLTYHGYLYDCDTNMYYIENQHYNPHIGRYINFARTEEIELPEILKNNPFAFNKNNPMLDSNYYVKEAFIANSTANYLYNKDISDYLSDYLQDFIYNQEDINTVGKYRYGYTKTGPQGCGWVATYNSLKMLGEQVGPHDIIREFEMNGMTLDGLTGIHPLNVAHYLFKKGYAVTITVNKNEFKKAAQNNTTNIMCYRHPYGGHYVAIKYDGEKFIGYNTFCDKNEPDILGDEISVIKKSATAGEYEGLLLISIS